MKKFSIVIITSLLIINAGTICLNNARDIKGEYAGSINSNTKLSVMNSNVEKMLSVNIPNHKSSKIIMVNTKSVKGTGTKGIISAKEIGKFTLELINTTGNWGNIEPFFPYMTSDQIKEVVDIYIQKAGNTKQVKDDLSRYIGKEPKKLKRKKLTRGIVDKRAIEVLELTANWGYITPLLPYMTAEAVDECVILYQQKTGDKKFPKEASSYISGKLKSNINDNNSILANEAINKNGNIDFSLLPKMKKSEVDKLAIIYINTTGDFSYVYNLRQYMSTKGIDKAVTAYMKKSTDYGIVGAMLEFMSKEASKALAKKYFEDNKNGKYEWIYEPYM